MRKRFNRRRRGFTLMEILLVMAILIVLSSLVTFSFITIQRNALRNAAQMQISTLSQACDQFQMKMNRYPNQLIELRQAPQGTSMEEWGGPYLKEDIPSDPWKNQYIYSLTADQFNQQTPLIVSAGPDGQQGTADDVSSQKKK
jgi:general secretion pathway protein G